MGDKMYPFLVLGHGDGAIAKLFNEAIVIVGLTLEDAGISVVCFLNFTDDNGLELTTRAFEVEMRLSTLLADMAPEDGAAR